MDFFSFTTLRMFNVSCGSTAHSRICLLCKWLPARSELSEAAGELQTTDRSRGPGHVFAQARGNELTSNKVLPRQGVCPVHGVICGRLATIPEGSTVHSMVRANLRGAADIQVVRSPEQRSQRTASRFDTSWQDKQTQIV